MEYRFYETKPGEPHLPAWTVGINWIYQSLPTLCVGLTRMCNICNT